MPRRSLGTGTRLSPLAIAYTDELGHATVSLAVEEGRAGEYPLVIGTAGTLEATIAKDIGVALDGLRAGLNAWETFVVRDLAQSRPISPYLS